MNSAHLSRGDSEIRKKEREEKSKLLEQLYVHDVYDRIASDFEEQQYQPWPKVKDFLLGLESGSLVADVGCGNGHYLNVNPNISVIGVDRSFNLLRAAESRVPGVNCRADCVALPFRDNQFDAVLFIGVMHHLVSSERQVKALLELSRILRPGGTILLYTWAYEQQKRKFNGQDLLVPRYPSVGEDNPHCNCHRPTTKSSGDQLLTLPNQSQLSVLDKLERIFVRPFNLFINLFKLNSHGDSIETGESKDYINSLPSTQSDTLGDKSINLITKCSNSIYSNTLSHSDYHYDSMILVPKEFRVREFPASSLFSVSKVLNGKVSVHKRDCVSHSTNPARSRDDRFYHVFKRGELENLIKSSKSNLVVSKCYYTSGYWCATITKNTL